MKKYRVIVKTLLFYRYIVFLFNKWSVLSIKLTHSYLLYYCHYLLRCFFAAEDHVVKYFWYTVFILSSMNIYWNKLFVYILIKVTLWRNLCWIWKTNQHIIGFTTFKLPLSTILCLTSYTLFLTIWVYNYQAIWTSSVSWYTTWTIFHQHFVTMKYRWMCIYFYLLY